MEEYIEIRYFTIKCCFETSIAARIVFVICNGRIFFNRFTNKESIIYIERISFWICCQLAKRTSKWDLSAAYYKEHLMRTESGNSWIQGNEFLWDVKALHYSSSLVRYCYNDYYSNNITYLSMFMQKLLIPMIYVLPTSVEKIIKSFHDTKQLILDFTTSILLQEVLRLD